jgi:uncharacterized protein (TIGR03067 family)
MSRYGLMMVGIVVLLGAAGAKDDVHKDELKKFQGTWVMESGEKDGQKLAAEDAKKSKIIFKGKDCTVETPHQSKETIKAAVLKLEPGKKPKEISWKRSNGPDAGKEMLAIYEWIDNDQFRVCFAPAGKERPTEFGTKAGSGHFLHNWERVKE